MIQSATEMLPSLEKGGEGVAHGLNCPPRMAGSCLADALVISAIICRMSTDFSNIWHSNT